MRYLFLLSTMIIFTFISSPAWAQQQTAEIPQGWEIRFDHASANTSDVEFTVNENVLNFKADARGAAIYYKPTMTASGSFSVKATFTQNKITSSHPEAYGLFIGGKNLQSENQHYLYFEIHRSGEYLIKRRTGTDTHTIVDWTSSDSIIPMENSSQPVTNKLKITVNDNYVSFWINGEKVSQLPVSHLQYTEGVVGLRVNHHLNLTVSNFELND